MLRSTSNRASNSCAAARHQKVILIGFSGGGPSTTFYQATAEKGRLLLPGAEQAHAMPDALPDLPRADGLLLLDAHPGNTVNSMRSLNPAVLDENDPSKIDFISRSLRSQEWVQSERPVRSIRQEFMDRYFKAQAARMNRLDRQGAGHARRRSGRAKVSPTDDAPFIVYRDRARLMDFSMSVHPGTTRAARSCSRTTAPSDRNRSFGARRRSPKTPRLDKTLSNGTKFLTLTSFLSANAIRAGIR